MRQTFGHKPEDFALTIDRFGCVPRYWIPLYQTLAHAKTANALMTFADREGHARVGVRLIAKTAGISVGSAHRWLRQMETDGWLSIQPGEDGQRSLYWVVRDGRSPSKMNTPFSPRVNATVQPKAEHGQSNSVPLQRELNPKITETMRAEWAARKQTFADRIVEAAKKGVA